MISGAGINIRTLSHYHSVDNFSPDKWAMHHEATLNPLADEFIPTKGHGILARDRKETVVVHGRIEGTLNPLAEEFRPGQWCSVHVGGYGQNYTLNPKAKEFAPCHTPDAHTRLTEYTGGVNHKRSDVARALADQTNDCIENYVADPDRVDREAINDSTDGCNVSPNRVIFMCM